MKRYFIGIITTIILIVTLCSCSTESNNANNAKMIKLTTFNTKNVQEIYVNIDNIIAIYPKDITIDGTTKTTSRIYCTNTVVGSHCIEVNESPEEIMKLINN